MTFPRAPSDILRFLYLCFVGYLVFSAWQLPERVATHFNIHGQPDAWMIRSYHLLFMVVFGLAFPLFLVGMFFVIRFVPQGLNIPNRVYWLAPEAANRDVRLSFSSKSLVGLHGSLFCHWNSLLGDRCQSPAKPSFLDTDDARCVRLFSRRCHHMGDQNHSPFLHATFDRMNPRLKEGHPARFLRLVDHRHERWDGQSRIRLPSPRSPFGSKRTEPELRQFSVSMRVPDIAPRSSGKENHLKM